MMDGSKHVRQAGKSRRMLRHAMPENGMDIGFIEHGPMFDAIAEPPGHDASVIGEFFRDIAIEPAALLLKRGSAR